MGDANSTLTDAELRHLLRRSGFGVDPKEFARMQGWTRGAAVDRILKFRPQRSRPTGRWLYDMHNKWLKMMLKSKKGRQLQEKLVLFWHDHFATNFSTVANVKFMSNQNKLFRSMCKGSFKDLVKAVNKDPAMIVFLDTEDNFKDQPNENYARELMELFTIGVFDRAGNPNYTEDDIQQIGRAFTGWYAEENGKVYFDGGYRGEDDPEDTACHDEATDRHDYVNCYPERGNGTKVVFENRGGFGPTGADIAANGEGPQEIDTVVDILFAHTDTDGENTVARYVGRRLFEFFAYANPATAVIDVLISDSAFDTTFVVEDFLRSLFVHDEFYATKEPAADGGPRSVKWPVDFAVSTLKTLSMKPRGRYMHIAGGGWGDMFSHLDTMGQRIFEPPSVFGWDLEEGWLSSSTLLARYEFVRDVTSAHEGAGRLKLKKIVSKELLKRNNQPVSTEAILDDILTALGMSDQFTAAERQALETYLGPGPHDLTEWTVEHTWIFGLIRLILTSPAYQTH